MPSRHRRRPSGPCLGFELGAAGIQAGAHFGPPEHQRPPGRLMRGDRVALRRVQLASVEVPALPVLVRQLVAQQHPQQLEGRERDVVPPGIPVM